MKYSTPLLSVVNVLRALCVKINLKCRDSEEAQLQQGQRETMRRKWSIFTEKLEDNKSTHNISARFLTRCFYCSSKMFCIKCVH